MLTYEEALDYLYSFVDYSATRVEKYSAQAFDLSRMAVLLGLMGNPHTKYPCLHLAGTKGKGSVSAMCASVLRAAGYRAGFYTSPHLQDFCERIQINGQLIPRQAVAAIVDDLRPLAARVPKITHWELVTALSFEYFAREEVDVAVIEVGLGGRLDSTNVITPLVSVITSLSYDHTNLLGNTLAQIAGEKAGIVKPGVPLVSAPQPPEALEVLRRTAHERGAPLTLVGRDWLFRPLSHSLESQTFEIWSAEEERQLNALRASGHVIDWRPTRLELPLLGAHQVENGAVAVAALGALRQRGLPLSPDAIREGLRAVRWPGRFEILGRQPFVVADGAHNRDSARKLAAALDDYFPGQRVVMIFGASSDKDVDGMFAELLPHAAHLIFTQAVQPRALDPEELMEPAVAYRRDDLTLEMAVPVARALERALELSGPDDVVLACGSLFVVAEVRAAWGEGVMRET
jgi:dihydrofolate synthase/folylpolyglutamate synthase